MILPKSQWPKYLLKFKEIKGICWGKCIHGTAFRKKKSGAYSPAHAHATPGCSREGWICLMYKKLIKNHELMLHEIAHVIVSSKKYSRDHNHDDVWRRQLLKIGGTLNSFPTTGNRVTISYKKKRK